MKDSLNVKIEIVDMALDEFSGVSKKTGNPYHIRRQVAYLHRPGQKYPVSFKIQLDERQVPYAPGFYSLSADSIEVDSFGALQFSRSLKLVPETSVKPVGEKKAV